MTRRTKEVAEQSAEPSDPPLLLDGEPEVKAALKICADYGIGLSGSVWEKSRREVIRLRPKFQELDSLQKLTNGPELKAAEANQENLDNQYRRIRVSGERPSADLEAELDASAIRLPQAKATYWAVGAELTTVARGIQAGECQARHGLASVLRDRALTEVAAKIRPLMTEDLLILHSHRRGRPLPPAVEAAMQEGEAICKLADVLAAEGPTGNAYLGIVLGENLSDVLLPALSWDALQVLRRQRPRGSAVERMSKTLDQELGMGPL